MIRSALSAIAASFRRWMCRHECNIEDIRRTGADAVQCPCRRCGKALMAPYGLALEAKLTSRGRP